ncbi:MAG TPA: hypothetical protein VNR39_19530 [Pseudolabrys sp.]|nr:hypothetical protein [Pseudolabrys sp.]
MKTLTTMTAVAALVAGVSIAGAQTQNDGKTVNPSSINAAPTQEGNIGKSGSQPYATKDMKGGAKTMQGTQNQAQTANPGSINAAPTTEGEMGRSGTQPKGTADMPSRTAPRSTTGTSAEQPTVNPAAPNAKPLDNAGGTGGGSGQ